MPNIRDSANPTPQSLWETPVDQAVASLHGPRANTPVGAGTIEQAKTEFSTFLQGKWSSVADEVASDHATRSNIHAAGDSSLQHIVSLTFDGDPLPRKGDLNRAVVTANRLATEGIMDARERFGHPQTLQVVPFRHEGSDEIRFAVIKEAPKIENLVLRGGGAKGAGYPPTLVEMERFHIMDNVHRIVGTSAGAITAAVLASGMSAEQFQELSDKTDMNSFKDKPPNWSAKYPGLSLGTIGFHGGTAMELVDRVSATSVKAFLDSNDGKAKLALGIQNGTVSRNDAHSVMGLTHQDFNIDRTHQTVTFRDLDVLSKVDSGKFKSLTLTGWNTTDKQLTYFNFENTPDMPIAIASRISMSIPYFFAAVKYDAGQGEKTWVDGGVGSNMPAGAIFDGIEHRLKDATARMDLTDMVGAAGDLKDARARTPLMTFDEAGTAHKIQHDPQSEPPPGGLVSRITASTAGIPDYAAAGARDKQRVHDASPDGLVVFHGDMGTLSLWAGEEQKAAALGAQMHTVEAIAQRQHQARHEVFTDATSGVRSLTLDERSKFIEAGPPNRAAFLNSVGVVDERLYQAAVEFHREVVRLASHV